MFANFKKAFKEDDTIDQIPPPILEALSDNLPEGLKYVQIDYETCGVVAKDGNTDLKIDVKLPTKYKFNNPNEVMEFLYRTQQELEANQNEIEVNGMKINIKDLVIQPLCNNFNDHEISITLKPQPFPDPFPVPIEYEGKELIMNFKRQPYADMHKSLFKSVDSESIIILYIIDEVLKKLNITVQINIDKAKDIDEIVTISSIYNGFRSGNIKIGKYPLNGVVNGIDEDSELTELIVFWEKVSLISQKLKIKFKPQKEISTFDVELVEKLYKSLVQDKAYKEPNNLEKLTVTTDTEFNKSEFLNKDGINLILVEEKNETLLSQEITLWDVVLLTELKFSEVMLVEGTHKKYDLIINPLDTTGSLKITKYFSNKQDAEKYRTDASNLNDIIENAEVINL